MTREENRPSPADQEGENLLPEQQEKSWPPEWLGNDQTLVGNPDNNSEGSDRLPVVVVDDDSSNWLGTEKTTLPESRIVESNKSTNYEEWAGSEVTMVGAPVPNLVTPIAKNEDEWMGNDATIIGTPSPQVKLSAGQGGITTGGGKKTNSTMDDGWHLKGRQGPLTGQTIGDYEIGGILGEGGMGTVYRAKQISLKRRVALKVLPPHLASNAQMRQRFEQEATTASLLNSPHVVQVFAAGSHNDMVYFVMEFVEGTDLSEKISEKHDAGQLFTPDEATNFIIQAARGLAEANKHNIVHRDIKPANLMITTKGVVKIADFGISKIAGEHGLTMTGTAVGTPAYCSPEQGRGDKVDARADIYSLGVVFYELLTGRKPFDGTTANALIYQHNYAEPTLITALRAEVPDAYQAVALKCLQKDPAKRYQDAAELVGDLERVRAGSAPMTALMNAFGTGADEAMRRLGIKQRKIWPYIAAALVLVALIASVVVWQTRQTAEQQTIAADIDRLRKSLSGLDTASPIKQGARDELDQLIEWVSQDDADVKRWDTKLKRVEGLQTSLGNLDTAEIIPTSLRIQATVELDRYREDVGSAGEDTLRWQKKLQDAQDAIVTLRKNLTEVDQATVVSTSMAERLAPLLAQLAILAGEADEDVKRWQGKIGAVKDRVAALRAKILPLNKLDNVLTQAQLSLLEQDLAGLRALVGEQDQGVVQGQNALATRRQAIAAWKENVARLDAVEWATTALQAAVAKDLAEFAAVADPNDPDLKRWQGKIAESNNRIQGLRKNLSRLDQQEALSVAEKSIADQDIIVYGVLVGPDDGQLQVWEARLRAERDAIAALTATLVRFGDPKLMKMVELDAAAKAVSTLGKLGALAETKQRLYEGRIADERQALNTLRQSLRSRDGATVTIDQQLVDDLNRFAQLVGEEDADVQRWRSRVSEYERLHVILVTLDRSEPLPDDAAKLIETFASIVGPGASDVQRWRAKVTKVADLKERLAKLDQVVSMPDNATANVEELVKEVSDKDIQAKRWLKKVLRVNELFFNLQKELEGAYVLPQGTPRLRDELLSLVGEQDEQAADLSTRVAILIGPGRPAWASSAGREEFGLWAELTEKGSTQRFRYIPAGSFIIGSPENEPGRDRDETQVRIKLSKSFWLADTECTQDFWSKFGTVDNSRFKGSELPVERISWDDAKAFCGILSTSRSGLRARLPTEAEWEYAGRAGMQGAYVSHQGNVETAKLITIAWFAETTASTQGVKRRFGNALALFDMHGNVWEWCEDRYGTYSPTPVTDPVGREQDTRVARGGSWGDRPDRLRMANRLAVRQNMRTLYLGMRVLVDVDWPEGHDPTSALQNDGLLQQPVKAP